MTVRNLCYDDFSDASRILWKSFYEAEKNNHSMNGMERFRDLTEPLSLSMNFYDGKNLLFGLFDEKLVAVGAVALPSHVLLLYVDPEHQKKGYGKALLEFLEAKCEGDRITLNSSDSAIEFYKKHGYVICGDRKIEEELIFTPMMKKIRKIP